MGLITCFHTFNTKPYRLKRKNHTFQIFRIQNCLKAGKRPLHDGSIYNKIISLRNFAHPFSYHYLIVI